MKPLYILLITLCLVSCKKEEQSKHQLGVVNMEISGKAEAIPVFEKGLLLLHSFEYDDAREAFLEAQKLDPKMPMAYWGEALTYNHSLWSEQNYEEASAALAKLEDFTYEEYCGDLEQDFIQSAKILYAPKTEKKVRDQNYANFMESLYEKYPDSNEVAAFYAISLLGSVPEGRDEEIYEKGALIAQGILKENPNHPGALHYLIHSYDDPKHAPLALDAAHAYAQVAPDASHALHMPSHIFVAMGMWDEVIASNIDSYEASISRMKEKNLDNDARGYHAFHWLEYGYLQKGQVEEAEKMVWEMQKYSSETPSPRARVHMVFLKGTYLAETDNWNHPIADIEVDLSDLNLAVKGQYHFIEGMKAYNTKNTKAIDSIIKVMEQEYDRGSFVVTNGSAKLCSSVGRGDITNSDLQYSLIQRHQLEALRADLSQNLKKAEEHFLASIELDENMSYSFGPPFIKKPTRELYADWLAEKGRMEEAKAQYSMSLERAPKKKSLLEGIEYSEAQLN